MSEKNLKAATIKAIRSHYPHAWIYHPSDRWYSGIPDLFILIRGVLAAIELKTDKGVVSPIQRVTLDKMKNAGAKTAVCRSVKEVLNFIQEEVI